MRMACLLALAALPVPIAAREAAPTGLRVERVVLLMRHGVRPPTKAPAMPAGVAARPWPTWPVAPGWLTPHGAAAVRLVAVADRAEFVDDRLVPANGCPAAGSIRIVADSDQRTIATAEAYRDALLPNCNTAIEHRSQGEHDPRFSPVGDDAPIAETAARDAVLAAAGVGGIAAVEANARPELTRLDAILCGDVQSGCGISAEPSALVAAKDGRAKLTGALDRGSTAAQILLLQYAEGKSLSEVGWGHASASDISRLSRLHAVEFGLLARPLPLARRNMVLMAPLIRDAILAARGPSITMIAGHDTNVASLAGLLGVHWTVPGFATDDPSPGGALMLERLVDRRGRQFVRVVYRSQTLDQIRLLSSLIGRSGPFRQTLPIDRCGAVILCPMARFAALLKIYKKQP